MLTLLSGLDSPRFRFVQFIAAETDNHSIDKAHKWVATRRHKPSATFHLVTRAREVGQGWLSSAVFTMIAFVECIWLVLQKSPDVVLLNGPGTCIPVAYAAFLGKLLGFMPATRIVFVESFARVTSLSLTGKLIFPIADRFILQWPQQHSRIPHGTEYIGRIF